MTNEQLYAQYMNGEITWADYLSAKEKLEHNSVQTQAVKPDINTEQFNRAAVKTSEQVKKMQRKINSLSALTTVNFVLVILMAWTLFFQPFFGQLNPANVVTLEPFTPPVSETITNAPTAETQEPVETETPPEPTIPPELLKEPASIEQLAEYALPAAFNVTCRPGGLYFNTGSGWALTLYNSLTERNETVIITNHHVISECLTGGQITAQNDTYGRVITALHMNEGGYWLGGNINSLRDLAVLTITDNTPVNGLPLQREPVVTGQWVMVIGYPGDQENQIINRVISYGIINEMQKNTDLIVTNAQVKQGNSGGPMLNSRGEIVGTIFALTEDTNLGLAQPLLYHCTIAFECLDSKILLNNNTPVKYTPLQVGECLGPTVGKNYNYANMSCDNPLTVAKITSKVDPNTPPENMPLCLTDNGISETIGGVKHLYCSQPVRQEPFTEQQ